MPTELRVKRIYDEPCHEDGFRLLVDRLWPRGVRKEAARIDLWSKEFTPSNDLRKWFHENPTEHEEFAQLYRQELADHKLQIEQIFHSISQSVITLVTATKDFEHGHTSVLKGFLQTLTR